MTQGKPTRIVYILHIDFPDGAHTHYVGSTNITQLSERLRAHRYGRGAIITDDAKRQGADFKLGATLWCGNYRLEHAIARSPQPAILCRFCTPRKPTGFEAQDDDRKRGTPRPGTGRPVKDKSTSRPGATSPRPSGRSATRTTGLSAPSRDTRSLSLPCGSAVRGITRFARAEPSSHDALMFRGRRCHRSMECKPEPVAPLSLHAMPDILGRECPARLRPARACTPSPAHDHLTPRLRQGLGATWARSTTVRPSLRSLPRAGPSLTVSVLGKPSSSAVRVTTLTYPRRPAASLRSAPTKAAFRTAPKRKAGI